MVCGPLEVLCYDVLCREREFLTARLHACYVSILTYSTECTVCVQDTNKVVVVTSVPVELEVDAVVEETEVNT